MLSILQPTNACFFCLGPNRRQTRHTVLAAAAQANRCRLTSSHSQQMKPKTQFFFAPRILFVSNAPRHQLLPAKASSRETTSIRFVDSPPGFNYEFWSEFLCCSCFGSWRILSGEEATVSGRVCVVHREQLQVSGHISLTFHRLHPNPARSSRRVSGFWKSHSLAVAVRRPRCSGS